MQSLTFLITFDNVLMWVANAICNANGCADYCQRTKFCKVACESHCCKSGADALKLGSSDIEDDHDHIHAVGGISAAKSCNASKAYNPSLSSTVHEQRERTFAEAVGNKTVSGWLAAESITIGFTRDADAIVHYGTFGLANIVPADVLGGLASGHYRVWSRQK